MADVNITVGNEVIRPIIEAKIQAAILAEFGAVQGKVMEEMITRLLSSKVDQAGKPSNYSSDIPFLEWVVKDVVMKASKEALVEFISQKKPEIVKEVRRVMQKRITSMAENFVDHLEAGTKDSWRTSVNVTFTKPTSD